MSISGKTMNIDTLTVGGVNVKTALTELMTTRTFTLTPPNSSKAITVDLQGCTMSYVTGTPYCMAMVDADNKLIFGVFA